MFKFTWFLLVLLAGCGEYIRVDISRLDGWHQVLFAVAAEQESIEVTEHGAPWDMRVRYNNNMHKTGWSYRSNSNRSFCRISINTTRLNSLCGPDYDVAFIGTARHEMGHCKGFDDNQNPDSIMYAHASCD